MAIRLNKIMPPKKQPKPPKRARKQPKIKHVPKGTKTPKAHKTAQKKQFAKDLDRSTPAKRQVNRERVADDMLEHFNAEVPNG